MNILQQQGIYFLETNTQNKYIAICFNYLYLKETRSYNLSGGNL